jgi:Glutaredoxin-like domain (DUF836)
VSEGGTLLLLLGKPDCHLCHEMAVVVREAVGDRLPLVEADVRSQDKWRRYRMEIPVLLLGEEEVVRHRTTKAELRERLSQLGLAL